MSKFAGEDSGRSAGVPIAVKDVIITKGVGPLRVEAARKFHSALRCDRGVRLEQAGGMVIGKTNCDEFAMGLERELGVRAGAQSSRSRSCARRFEWRIGGGGGAGRRWSSLGSDTGGSIRQPASFCGIVGVTPTYGRVSRYGLMAFASSLDHMARSRGTCRMRRRCCRQCGAGSAGLDLGRRAGADYAAALDGNVRG